MKIAIMTTPEQENPNLPQNPTAEPQSFLDALRGNLRARAAASIGRILLGDNESRSALTEIITEGVSTALRPSIDNTEISDGEDLEPPRQVDYLSERTKKDITSETKRNANKILRDRTQSRISTPTTTPQPHHSKSRRSIGSLTGSTWLNRRNAQKNARRVHEDRHHTSEVAKYHELLTGQLDHRGYSTRKSTNAKGLLEGHGLTFVRSSEDGTSRELHIDRYSTGETAIDGSTMSIKELVDPNFIKQLKKDPHLDPIDLKGILSAIKDLKKLAKH